MIRFQVALGYLKQIGGDFKLFGSMVEGVAGYRDMEGYSKSTWNQAVYSWSGKDIWKITAGGRNCFVIH